MKIKFWEKNTETPQFFSPDGSTMEQPGYATDMGDSYDVVHEPVVEVETAYKRAARWIIVVGAALLPIFFLPWTTSVLELNKQFLLMGVAGVGLVVWLLHIVVSGQLSSRSTPVDKGVIAFLAATGLATIFSFAKFRSLFGDGGLSFSLVTVAALTILYFLIVNLFEDEGKSLRTFLTGSIVLALFYGLLQLFAVYILKFPFATSRIFNTIGSVNSLGLLAAAALPLFWKDRSELLVRKGVSFAGIVLSLAILILLNWWVLWTVAIIGMVSLVALESLNRPSEAEQAKQRIKISNFILPMTVIILGVFFMAVNVNFSFVKKNLPIEVAPSFKLSLQIARDSLMKSPAFGFGPENFSMAFDMFGAKQIANTTLFHSKFLDATSEFFNLIIQGGLVMLAAFLFLLYSIARMVYKAAHKDLDSSSVGLFASIITFTAAIFLYPFSLANVVVFYVLLGLGSLSLWSGNKKVINVEEKASTSLISSLGFIGSLILLLVGSYFGANIYLADYKYAQAATQKNPQQAADLLVQSINWNNQSDLYYRSASQVALSLLATEINKKDNDPQRTQKVQNYITTAVSLAQKATQVEPKEVENWANLGLVYQNLIRLVDGADRLAEDSYKKAAELRPGDPSYYYNIGSMYLVEADLIRQLGGNSAQIQQVLLKSEDYLKKATDMSSNYGLAIYSLGAVYDRENKVGEAIKQLEKLAPFNANQPNLAFELGLLYYRFGQKDKALDQLQRAILLAPDYANARWYAALIFEERNNFPAAIDQLQKILSVEVNKDNQVVISKLTQLENGQKAIPPVKVIDQKPIQ